MNLHYAASEVEEIYMRTVASDEERQRWLIRSRRRQFEYQVSELREKAAREILPLANVERLSSDDATDVAHFLMGVNGAIKRPGLPDDLAVELRQLKTRIHEEVLLG